MSLAVDINSFSNPEYLFFSFLTVPLKKSTAYFYLTIIDMKLGRYLTIRIKLKPIYLPTLSLLCVVRRCIDEGRVGGGVKSEHFIFAVANRQVYVCVETNFL